MRLLVIIPKVIVVLIGAALALYSAQSPAQASARQDRHLHPTFHLRHYVIPAHSGAALDCGPDERTKGAPYFDADRSVKVGAHWRVFHWDASRTVLRTHKRYGGRVWFDGWRVSNTTNRRAVLGGRCRY